MAKGLIGKGKKAAKDAAETTAEQAPSPNTSPSQGPAPDAITKQVIAELALRGGGQLLHRVVERALLSAKNSRQDATHPSKGRSMAQALVGTALVRIATRSVPGALVVGGGLLAKTLYDRRKGKAAARSEASKAIAKQAEKGADEA